MIFVIGGRGRLGRALTARLPWSSTVALDRSVYSTWTQADMSASVTRFFEPFAGKDCVIFVAAGVTDPKRSLGDHIQVNLTLPKNLIKGAARLGIRVVTFGTIMEEIVGRSSGNPYFDSKVQLSNYIQTTSDRRTRILHIRIHTLYGGGPPDDFMFLGQLLQSIQLQAKFKMSTGTQLREYHHVDDEVDAIWTLVNSEISGAINLSHGAPVRLRELACYVCEKFECLDLLEIGAIPSSDNDNYHRTFERPSILHDANFRETFSSVLEYMKSHRSDVRKNCC